MSLITAVAIFLTLFAAIIGLALIQCLRVGINPKAVTAVPLLFAIDGRLGIPDNFNYVLNCTLLHDRGARYCASDISSSGCGGCGGGCAGQGCGSDGGDGGCGGGGGD